LDKEISWIDDWWPTTKGSRFENQTRHKIRYTIMIQIKCATGQRSCPKRQIRIKRTRQPHSMWTCAVGNNLLQNHALIQTILLRNWIRWIDNYNVDWKKNARMLNWKKINITLASNQSNTNRMPHVTQWHQIRCWKSNEPILLTYNNNGVDTLKLPCNLDVY